MLNSVSFPVNRELKGRRSRSHEFPRRFELRFAARGKGHVSMIPDDTRATRVPSPREVYAETARSSRTLGKFPRRRAFDATVDRSGLFDWIQPGLARCYLIGSPPGRVAAYATTDFHGRLSAESS